MTLSLPSFTRSLGRAVSLLVLLLGASLPAQAQTIRYVKPAGTGNGSSWANASGNLQAMINASVATDQVWVAAGTYKPGGNANTDRNVSFAMKIGVLIYGGFVGSETSLSQRPVINTTTPSSTTLSGNIGNAGSTADNSYHVISNPMDLINTAVLDGFIITGGNANGGSSAGAGGGMYNPGNDSGLGASPTVRNCSFQGNSAGIGGAMTNYSSATSNPVLVNCLFRGNSATISGGAIYNYKDSGAAGNPVLTNCSFQNNSAGTSGGAIFNVGFTYNCAPELGNCSFQNNSAPQGGAFYNDGAGAGGYSRPQLTNCVLFGNGGSNAIRNSPNSYVEAAYSLLEAGAVFIDKGGSNVSGVTVNPFASTSSVALNACAPAINSGNGDIYNGPSTDLAGNDRFYAGGQIDMGAVEFQAAPSSITITPPSVSTTTVGAAFSQAFSASGGSGPYILASGSLPPGITLATSGVLSGTPTQYGYYTFAVKVVDPVTGCTGISAAYTLLVRSSKPIRYVKVGGTSNGDSWANASGDLQSQINVAGAEQVWVAAGTYKPGPAGNTDRTISFAMRGGLEIYGGFVGNETALSTRPAINPVRGNPSATILSGDIGAVGNNADNSYHVILNRNGLQATAILDGFVITGGNANYEGGGGMANICQNPAGAISPTVRNCSFQGNTATSGGAILNDASGGNVYPLECNPTLINCVFQDNSARSGGAVSNNASGGTFCSPQFDNCYFINNTADNGGAMDNYSGSRSQSNVRLTNCLFQGNSATSTGGAILNDASGGSSSPVLINCSFQGNSIKGDARNVSRLGGAICFSTSGNNTGATLTNCSFQGNTADYGGAIYVSSYQANSETNVDLISCVVFGNGGAGTFEAGNVSQNSYGLIYLRNTLIEASATKYQDRGGNITTNITPFASPNSPALAASSPAVNAGNSGVQGTDVAGNPRIVGCRIDMGAYEFQYDPTVAITAQPATNSVVCGRAPVSVPVGVSGQYLTYQWYKDSFANPVTGQTSATLTLTNAQPANAGSYSLVVTGSCNSLTSTAFTLTVNQPTVSISPVSATICQGKSVLLTASGASTYTWSNNTTGNTLSATTAGTYSVTGVDGNGCTNFATATVTENKPTVSISPVSATICQGKSVLLTASGASTYTWSNNTTDNTLSATTAGTYSVTGVDGNGCTNTATATITENKPTVSITPNPASICQGSSVLLTASGASTGGALSYTWSNNTTSNTLSATTVGTYSVTGVAVNGCYNSATATVTDTRPIVSITATPSATVTQGASITLTASGAGLTSFAWSSGSTGNSTVINPATSAPYSVTVRNAAGCVTVASLDITVTPISCGPVIYVTQTGSGQRDGSSWNNALGSSQLQFGINTAASCGNNGQVWVAAGTYKPTTGNDRNASFALRNGVTIYGGFVGNETALTDHPAYNPVANRPSSTTLSGDIGSVGNTSDNSFRVVSNPASLSLTATAVLDGVVVTGGAGGTLGGGMFNDGSSPTLRNCSFVGNSVSASGSTISRGGAIYNGNSSSPQLYNCYFLTNSAFSSAGTSGFGGAMANLNSSNPQLTNCNFVNNRVSGDALNQGGAIANNLNSSPQLINCSFLSNSASGGTSSRGGAVANGNGSNPQLINCSFLNNSVSGATSSTNNQGGAVYNGLSTPQLTNCVLFGNGGANTFYNATGGSVLDYSLLETTVTSFTAGTGNLTTDVSPFVSATDTRLNGCSPAINAGDNGANNTATDLDGNPRIYAGTPARIDMGAYEYQGAAGVVTTVPTVNTATVGVAFSQNFTASGGSAGAPDRSYSYSLASGILPPGLSLSNTGVLSGTPTQTGSFTITVRGQDATGCSGVSGAYVLTVTDAASPNPTLAGFTASQGAVCAGSVATFTATVGNVTGNYTYTLANGSNLLTGTATTSVFSQSITASGTGPQNFTLTVSANGQSVTSVTSLPVNPLPVASLINNGPLTCAQSSVTLTAGGAADASGSSYTFTSGNGVVVGTPGAINTVVVSTSGTYSVTVASASGCLSTTSTVVTADQTVPSISISSSSTTLSCASPTVSLSAIGSGSVRWSTGETTPVISVSVAGPYSVTATGGNSCSSVASMSVSQDNTVPVASLVSSGTLSCSVTSVTLTASPGGQRYTFSSGASQIGTSNQAVVSASGTYSVTVLSGNGCSAVASVSVSQDNTAPVVSLVSSGTLSCTVTSVTLTASPVGLNYLFSAGATQISTSNQAVVSMAGPYSVTVLSGNGCSATASTTVQSNTAAVSITNPTASTATVGVAFSQAFTASGGTSPYSYSLASGSLPPGLSLDNTGVLSGTPTQTGSFTLTVRGQGATGCSGVSTPYGLMVSELPSPIRYVRAGASGSGTSWADASGDLQSQINATGAQQVWVAQGTYKPTSGTDRTISFAMKNGVTIYGGFPGTGSPTLAERNPTSLTSVLSGDIGAVGNNADNSYHVINNPFIGSFVNNGGVLDGFTVTGGNANGGGDNNSGGGMYNNAINPTVINCVFQGNKAVFGGGIAGSGSYPTLINCSFVGNSAINGGGINSIFNSRPTLTNCSFVDNSATDGGGMFTANGDATLTNCSFVGNSASSRGGGMYNQGSNNKYYPTLTNCSFVGNSATDGGGLYNAFFISPTLTNCSLVGNTASSRGGGIYNTQGRPGIDRPTTLTNCVVFGNGGANTFGNVNGSSTTATYSLLEAGVTGYTDGGNNLTTDVSPFVSATDTRLNGCSPAINAGDNSVNSTTTDPDGNPRVYQNGRIDMGAYEYQGAAGVVTTVPTVNTATVGVSFSQNFTASGGTGPYSYSLASGSLPSGLSLSNTGVLSGTPTQIGSFTITVSATNASSCLGVSAPYVLTVTDASLNPTLAGFTASPGTVCVGSVSTFTATVGNVTGSYNYTLTNGISTLLTGSASGSPFSQSITASGTGTQSFTLTVVDNGQSASSVTALTINSLPVASLINNGPLTCAQSSVTLTASGAAGVPGNSYTFANGSGVVGTPGPVNTVVVSSAGTYSVAVANASGCVSTTSTVVTIDQNVPTISINPSSTTLSCASSTVSLSAIGSGSVRWSTGETTPVISVSAAGPYSVTTTSDNGCSAVATTSVTSDQSAPPVIITANPSLTITQGKSATLTASGASTYAWSTNENAPAIVVNTAGPYSVTGTAGNGCVATASVTLTVSPPGCGAGVSGPVWTGCLNTDWNTAGNWASGAVPTATDDVVIPSAPANQPVLSTTATAKSVEVQSGASLNITVAGSLTVNDSKSLDGNTTAFSNRGTVQNAGQLVLGNTAAIGQIGFWNRGIANNAGGQISIDRSTASALRNSSGTLTNTGAISIGSTTDAGSRGLRVDGGIVYNNPGGDITINRSGGLLNDATFVNASRLTIGNIALSAQDCIFSRGTFTNTATGEIRADRASSNGIWKAGGTFQNDGKILIGTVAYAGAAGILIDGTSFVNSAGADIQIDRVRRGLTNRSNFINAGQIRMGNRVALGERGMQNGNDEGTVAAVFTNQAGGLIQIDQTAAGQDGITNQALTTFTNAGTVTIGTLGSIGGNGISNAGTFANSACATLTVAAPINNGNSLTNAGLFTVSTTRTHSNTGTLTNNGLISYPQGNPIPNVVNNDVIAAPISSCVTIINPALQLGGNSSQFSVGTTWYTDAALTQSAGTYDQGSNTFTATSLAPGSSTTLYVAATDKANGCTKTVPVSVTLSATVTASISPATPKLTCASPTVSLTASGGSSYVWDDKSTNAVRTVSSSGPYSVTVNTGAGCSSVASVSVSQDNTTPVATLSASPSTTLTCAQTTLTLLAGGGDGYTFSGPGIVSQSGNQALVNVAGVYSVTVTNQATGCFSTTIISISQDAGAPVATISASPSATLTCAQTSLTLTANASGGSGYTYAFSPGASQLGTTNQATVTQAGSYSVTVTSATGCSVVATVTVSSSTSVATPDFATRGNQAIADGLTSVTVVQNTASILFNATNCSGTLNWSGNGQTGTTTLNAPTSATGVFVYQATCTVGSCVSSPASVTVTVTPANTAPVPTANANQTATVGQPFTYTANAFTDAETPNSLVYTASFNPANSLTFNPATRVIQGTPTNTGVTSVTITATDPGGLKASTTFTITVLPVPVVTNLTVLSRDPENGNLNTNTIKPYLLLQNEGTEAIPYNELTVRYYLTLENPVPLRFDINYAQMGNDKIHLRYVPLNPARQGAGGYIEFSFDASAGSLAPMSNAVIQDLVNKQDYTSFFQGDDYSYVNNANFAANNHITAYRNGVLVYGIEPLPTGPPAPLGLTLTATPTMLLTTGSPTLTASASGGTGPYNYAFSGPGTIQPNGNTANVSNLTAGVQTFTVVVTDATTPVNQTIAATVSVTVTTPVNQPPVATSNANQTATVGQMVTYTVNAFTDDTPNSLTYTVSIDPANGFTFNAATRMIQGTPQNTGLSSVTITATDPGGLSANTVFTITVNPAPVAPTALTLTASASPTTILTTGSTQLQASVSGGTPGYTYTFSGPGTIQTNGNTATVSNLPDGVQTFTVTARDATSPVNQTITTTVSVTVSAAPNQAPVATANANQTATQGVQFSYTASAFTDAETPNSLTYTASIDPANGFTFNSATRMIQGTPQNTGLSSVTLTATDPGGLSASTVFTITVLPAPVVTDRLTVYSRDPDNGQLNTNTLKPYLQLQNDGGSAIPYGELTVRYWLTVENPAPFRFEINYAQLGSDKVHLNYVPISPARQGATGYIEFRFDAAAGSLGANSNSGPIQDLINKQDYSYFNQGDDYSYVNNPNFAANPRITAYRNGVLIYGTEPPSGTRRGAESEVEPLQVRVLGNPVVDNQFAVVVSGIQGTRVRYVITDIGGHLVDERQTVPTGGMDRQTLRLAGHPAGIYLLVVTTATQSQTVKILKPE